MKPLDQKTQIENRFAFSLVEVTLALGIIAFAAVSLLGIMPIGLTTFRDSMDSTVATQIAQGVVSSARQGKFSDLANLPTPTFYDDQGAQRAGVGASNHIYKAEIAVTSSMTLPGNTLSNPNTARISVSVTRVSDPERSKTFQAWIVDNGL